MATILALVWTVTSPAPASAAGLNASQCAALQHLELVEAWPASCEHCTMKLSFEVALRFVMKRQEDSQEGDSERVCQEPVIQQTLRLEPGFVSATKARYGACAPLVLRRIGRWFEDLQLAEEELEELRRPIVRKALGAVAYRFRPEVLLSVALEVRVAELARRFRRRTRRGLVVTSGRRTPLAQAGAMLIKLRLGGRLFRLYRNHVALAEIMRAYKQARRKRLTRRETVAALGAVIAEQTQRGVFLSEHLKDNAVDIRTRGLKRRHVRLLERLARQEPGVRVKREGRPPHLHLAFPEKRSHTQ